MRKNLEFLRPNRIPHPISGDIGDKQNMCVMVKSPKRNDVMFCICSDGGGWDHVSVSLKSGKMPNWDEMCFVKGLFFSEEETVIQYHPPRSRYVNFHKSCLHLWRKQDFEMPLPDTFMIGPVMELGDECQT